VIPFDFITEWREHAPWQQDSQVEQDLIISRIIIEIFQQPEIANNMAFRGGTALYKLNFIAPLRYSEDIDLVQMVAGPIGPSINAIRRMVDPWLNAPKWKLKYKNIVMTYRYDSEEVPSLPMRLKIEINSREHFSVYGIETQRFSVTSRWFEGTAGVKTYKLEELLGTKLRALYQRRKGRDLFDLWIFSQRATINPRRIVECFTRYLEHDGLNITRAEFESQPPPAEACSLRPLNTAAFRRG
jgi:predicted nucleotidyltransferase component of viral defense system